MKYPKTQIWATDNFEMGLFRLAALYVAHWWKKSPLELALGEVTSAKIAADLLVLGAMLCATL